MEEQSNQSNPSSEGSKCSCKCNDSTFFEPSSRITELTSQVKELEEEFKVYIDVVITIVQTHCSIIKTHYETWFPESFCPCLSGFEILNTNRIGRVDGGICICIRKRLSSYEIMDIILRDTKEEQICCIDITTGKLILAGCVCSPPAGSNDERILFCLE
ncbi:RNA-directed DNA polymerase from mobile element jockey [Brachionus plicatilis]|uniref:RNA-directed DNA polymerase from mobile element jockey n=1 Tax=Brachionus plicatilis TaxID=10195 RepID=A0A3M7Q363_BRAPC|nr:RNA-directed DNA polymerase from mobile element jockey [Brachionus plicatilis]